METPALALIAARPVSLRYSLLALLARLPQIATLQSVEDTRSLLAVMSITQPVLVVVDVNLLKDESEAVLSQMKTIAPHVCVVILVDQIDQQQRLQSSVADLVVLNGYPAAELFSRIEQLLAQED